MAKSSYFETIQNVLSEYGVQRNEQVLSQLFKVIFGYSNTVLEIFKQIFNHVFLVYNASYNITNQHQQIEKIIKDLQEKLIVNENIVKRSTINIISVKFNLSREISKILCEKLFVISQDIISSRIINYLIDKKSEYLLNKLRKDLVRSENYLLFQIASHF
ncbi:hypothetical protein ABPG74_012092 [Tetrahymena malaccensis]